MYESWIPFIYWLVKNGYGNSLINILEGNSPYSSLDEYEKLDVHSRLLRSMSIKHLEYMELNNNLDLEKYPNIKFKIISHQGKFFDSYIEFFNAWNLSGFPGISIHNLQQFAKDIGYDGNHTLPRHAE